MEPFTKITAVAVPIDVSDLDTNQLCPTRFNKVPRGPQYARVLLHDHRFHADGSEKDAYILNRPPYRQARIMVARRNFGVGSSREMAVFALSEFGIRCVIASSFGDILFENCIRNGLLPVTLPDQVVDRILRDLINAPGANMTVDLPAQTVSGPGALQHGFSIRSRIKRRLMMGLDDIALTEQYRPDIEAFEANYRSRFDWLQRVGPQSIAD